MSFKFLPCYVLRGEHGEEKTGNTWGNSIDGDARWMREGVGGS